MKSLKININLNPFTTLVLAIVIVASLYSFKTSSPAPADGEYEFLQISVIESVVKAGAGRSRMISMRDNGEMLEEKLENFFSISGINFSNVRHNDNVITERVSKLVNEGWILENVVTGAYSDTKSTGLYLTRYLFKRAKA